ncbi:MAG: InlB B-repeat-containing protein, partial [Lachnospiraceae bacterium]|nr:InlB B-repeat-containing protein [Lachnospiraceae bacterium]
MENREIKRRRKQFIATLMAFVMIVGSLTGMLPATTAKATDNAYFLGVGSNTTNQYPELSVGDEIDPGVILAFGDPDEEIQPTFTFRYYDFNLLEKFKEVEDSSGSYTVEDYPVNGADKDQFARWKVSRLNTSSGDVLCVNLVAIAGTEEAITYQKSDQNWFDANDMGIPASPPSFYTPGFAMPGDCFPDAELGMYDDNSNYIEYPFIGWFRNGTIGESDLSIRATGIAATETAPVTLYAHFSQNTTKHNISYKTVSCNAIQSDTEYTDHVKFVKRENNPADFYVAVGVPKIGDAETDLEHYTFDGWYDAATGGTKYQSIPRNTTDNVTLYARFVPKEYSITYVTTMGNLEGTVSTDSATGYQYGTGVSVGTGDGMILAAQPNDNHYEFEGWHKQSDFSDDAITGIDTSEYGNVTLYAKYIPRTVALSLDDGEGVSTHGAASPQTLTYDAVLPQITVPTKTGYVFDGYYLEAGSGQANDVQYINANGVWQNVAGVTENNKWKSDADSLSLKAKWTAITASLTLVDGGNVTTAGSAASEQLTYDAAMPEIITVPTKTGYAFSGYYKSGTASQANDVQYINANGVWQQVSGVISDGKWKATDTELVLNAKWTPIQYAIAFDSNGSTDSMNPMTGLKYDAEYSISANTLTKDYYDFDGWKIQGTETTYADQATVKNLTSVNDATVTLVAQWKKKDYTITLDPAGGSVSDDAFTQVQTSGTYQRKYQVGDASFTLPTPTRTEYQFKGWKLEGADPAFNVTITTNAPENRTYTAVWEINRYSVTFKDDDGEVLKAAKSYDYNTPAASIEKPADPAAKRTDEYTYTFAGWSPTIDTVTGDATYTATYTATKNKYNVIWKDEDGTVLQTKEYEYGTLPANIEKPANPTKDR